VPYLGDEGEDGRLEGVVFRKGEGEVEVAALDEE